MPFLSLVLAQTFNHRVLALGIIACTSGCATRQPGSQPEPALAHQQTAANDSATAHAISLEGWQDETFSLPPSFAPELPTGTESLRFAPGWRDPASENFWSYAFVMWIDEPAPDAVRIADLLAQYYNGLMAAFAADKAADIRAMPAHIELSSTRPSHYGAQMRLIDAFATFQPINLRLLIDVEPITNARSIIRIRISPQPKEHAIWHSLEAAITSILARGPQGP